MIVDALRTAELDGMVERSARVRVETAKKPKHAEHRVSFSVPTEMAAGSDDGSPFLAACLLPAMRWGEDFQIDAPVSPRLLAATEEIQTIYGCWAPELRRASVTTTGEAPAREAAGGSCCFFSRGVDSMYSAAAEQQERVTHLVFIADLDPVNDEATRAEEVRLAEEAAARLGRSLVVARTNLRRFSNRAVDWADVVGAGLAAVAYCLDGGLDHVLIPSTLDWSTLGPCGSSPVLDHLFSTETMQIEHGAMGEGRHGKVAWLAEHRRDLMPLLKVCFRENRPDNCGKCMKCLWTMICLEAAGVLEEASGFPPRIDLDRVRAVRPNNLAVRISWLQAAQALEAAGRSPELRDAVLHSVERSVRPSVRERLRARWVLARGGQAQYDPAESGSPSRFYRNATNASLTVLRNGPRRSVH